MKKYIFILMLLLFGEIKSQIGFFGENSIGSTVLVPCGDADTMTIKLTAITNQSNVFLSIKLPINAIQHGHLSGGSLLFSNTDSLRINIGNMTSGQVVTVQFLVGLNCTTLSNGSFNINYRANSTTHTNTYSGQSYASAIYIPILQFSPIDIDSAGLVFNSIHTRKYKITNSSISSNSYFDTIVFKSRYKSGESLASIKIGSVSYTPTTVGDSLKFLIHSAMLDTDNKLNGGQFIIIEENIKIINECLINNSIMDTASAYWGCFSALSCISPIKQYALSQVAAINTQNITAYHTTKKGGCPGVSADSFIFTIKNAQNATIARNVSFTLSTGHIDEVIPHPLRLLHYMDLTTIKAFYNQVNYNILKDTILTYGKLYSGYATALNSNPLFKAVIPNTARWGFQFRIDSLLPGDSIRVVVPYYIPCDIAAIDQYSEYVFKQTNRSILGGHSPKISNLSSYNYCNSNFVYAFPNSTNRRLPINDFAYYYNTVYNLNIQGKSNFYTNDTHNLRLQINDVYIQHSYYSPRSRIYFEYSLPVGISPVSLNPASYNLGSLIAQNVTFSGGKLKVTYIGPNSVNQGLTSAIIGNLKLTFNCGAISGSRQDSIVTKIYYSPDTNCTTCLPIRIGKLPNYPISLHCPANLVNGGLKITKYEHRRSSLGLADYDNNGIPDGASLADKDSVKDDMFLNGDTLLVRQQGSVVVNSSSPSGGFTTAYAIHKFKFDNAGFSSDSNWYFPTFTQLSIYDKSASSNYISNIIPIDRIVFTSDSVYFIYDLSLAAIRGKGSIPPTYSFDNDDTLKMEVMYKFKPPIGRQETNFTSNSSFEIYLSTTNINRTNASTIASHTKYVDEIPFSHLDLLHVPSMRFGWPGGISVESSICNAVVLDQRYFMFNIGTYGTMYNKNQIFNNEFRPLGKPGKIYTYIPTHGVNVDSLKVLRYSPDISPLILPTPVLIPSSLWRVSSKDSALIEINGDGLFDMLYPNAKQPDEGVIFTINHYYTRTGPTKFYSPILPGLNLSNNDWFATKTPWIDNIPFSPYISKFGANNSSARFANPSLVANPIGFTSKTIQGNSTYFDVDITNQLAPIDMIVDSVWAFFKSHGGLYKLDSVRNLATGNSFKVDNGKLIKIGIMSLNLTRNLRVYVSTTTNTCDKDSFSLYFGWNCALIKSPRADSELTKFFVYDTTTHYISKYNPVLESKISVNKTTNLLLCDTLSVSNIIANVSNENAYEIDYNLYLPNIGAGITFEPNTFKLYYPANSTTPISIPAPTNLGGGNFQWSNISQYIPLLDTGGLKIYTDTIKSKALLTFKLRLGCGFYSGLNISGFAKSKCGSFTTNTYTTPLRLIAENKVIQQFYNFYTENDTMYSCGHDTINKLKSIFTNISSSASSTGSFDSIFVILPPGIRHNNLMTSNPRNPDIIKNLSDGTQVLSWNISGISPGTSQIFTYGVKLDDTVSCYSSKKTINRAMNFVQDTCILDNSICYTGVIKNETTTDIQLFKPNLSITSITTYSIPSGVNSEKITINYQVTNSGHISTRHYIKIYEDINNNGSWNSGETIISIDTIYQLLNNGNTSNHQLIKTIPSNQICRLRIELSANNCQCNSFSLAIPNPNIQFLGTDQSICSYAIKMIGSSISNSFLSYSWSPSYHLTNNTTSNPAFIFNNTASIDTIHTYFLTITRPNGCSTLDTISIRVFPNLSANAGGNKRACIQSPTIILGSSPTAINGKSPFNYTWTPTTQLSNSSISNPILNTSSPINSIYKVKITDANNCVAEDSISVIIDTIPQTNIGKDTGVCLGGILQIGQVTKSGQNYHWSPAIYIQDTAISNPYFTPTISGSYSYILTVKDIPSNCFSKDTIILSAYGLPIANAGLDIRNCRNDTSMYLGSSPTANGGTGPYSYLWIPNVLLNSNVISNPKVTIGPVGITNYELIVTDANNCIDRDTVKVQLDSIPDAKAGLDIAICIGADTIIGSTNISHHTYNWYPSLNLSDSTLSNPRYQSTAAGSMDYIVKITDTISKCYGLDTMKMTVYALPNSNAGLDQTRVLCAGDSVQLGINNLPNYDYTWIPNLYISNQKSGNPWSKTNINQTYYLEVKDILTSCKINDTVTVSVISSKLKTSHQTKNLTCFQDQSGSISINADSGYIPYLYKLKLGTYQSSNIISNLNAGNFEYEIMDKKGCIVVDTFSLYQPSELSIQLDTKSPLNCFQSNDGKIAVKSKGGVLPYSYSWDKSSSTTSFANNLAGGIHQITVRDSHLCSKNILVTIEEPSKISSSFLYKNNLCFGEQNAWVEVINQGGNPPYSYSWSNGKVTKRIENLNQGIYFVIIKDINKCSDTTSIIMIDPPKMKLDSIVHKDIECYSESNGEIKVYVPSTTYQFRLNNGKLAKNSKFTNLSSGLYNIDILDSNQCKISDTVRISKLNKLELEIIPKDTSIELGEQVNLQYQIKQGDSTKINYLNWTPSLGISCQDCRQPIVSPFITTIYQLEINYSQNCIAQSNAIVRITNSSDIYIPNAFTPEASILENKKFKVYSKNMSQIKLSIFNKWGEKVYESNQADQEGWDGYFKGEPSPMGIYTYYLEATSLDKQILTKKGSITLIR